MIHNAGRRTSSLYVILVFLHAPYKLLSLSAEMKKQRPAETHYVTHSTHSHSHSTHTKQRSHSHVEVDISQINAKSFTFRELATATKNFRQECLLGEGGFGRVYKGTLQSSGQVRKTLTLFSIYECTQCKLFFHVCFFHEDLLVCL